MNLKEKKRRIQFKNSELSQLFYKQLYINSSYNVKRKISIKFSEKDKDSIRDACRISEMYQYQNNTNLFSKDKYKL
jgi:hypothetical protein